MVTIIRLQVTKTSLKHINLYMIPEKEKISLLTSNILRTHSLVYNTCTIRSSWWWEKTKQMRSRNRNKRKNNIMQPEFFYFLHYLYNRLFITLSKFYIYFVHHKHISTLDFQTPFIFNPNSKREYFSKMLDVPNIIRNIPFMNIITV